jgi:phosphatidyl-myo-inositol dimannoside synthase
MRERKLLFLTLTSFSHMGGIEKFNRAFMHALANLASSLSLRLQFAGMYDSKVDELYTGQQPYFAFKGQKLKFVLWSIKQSLQSDIIILGHLNLSVIAVLLKFFAPQKNLIVICHGIEVFEPVSGFKKKALQNADHILAVSNYTRQQLIDKQGISAEKITIFPNTIDPFFQLPSVFQKPAYLQQRYGIGEDEKVIFTLTRLNSKEGYKGYDTVVSILPQLVKQKIPFKYILAGKADSDELQRMKQLIHSLGLEKEVIMTGFVPDSEVTDHYLLADVFVMPSKGEGFGIVYTEAMACGLPVIAGNKDGSTEALQFGKLGTLVDPDAAANIQQALINSLQQERNPAKVQADMLQYFSFQNFSNRLKKIVESHS